MNVIITKKEIYDTPNDAELGRLVRNKFWQEERNQRGPQFDDEHFGLVIGEDGLVKGIIRPDSDEYEKCIMCGETVPYLKSTHIDLRNGYIEGAGQLCKECYEKGS
ncbi:hypothetical protein EB155_02160 [archaeon]|nr:hypothetical protein [archaeon]NDB54474.1 hypothetical protein [archaeon]NDB78645.1 hypothetical protein [archaeon]